MRPLESIYRNLLLLLVVAYVAAMLIMWQQTLTVSERSLGHLNSLFSREFQRTLKENKRLLGSMNQELLLPGGGQVPEHAPEVIKKLIAAMPGNLGLGLAQPDGQVILDSTQRPDTALPNLAADPDFGDDFQDVIKLGQSRVGRPHYLESVGRWVVPVFAPLYDDNGELKTVFIGRLPAGASGKNWSNMTLPPGLQVTLVRSDGFPVFHQPLEQGAGNQLIERVFGRPLSASAGWQFSQLHGEEGLTRRLLFDEYQFYVRDYLEELDAHAFTSITQSALIKVWLLQMLIPTFFFIFCILSGWVAYRFGEKRKAGLLAEISSLSAWQHAALDSADFMVISTDTQGKVATFNRQAQIALGYRAEEVIGKSSPELFHDPDELERHNRKLSHEFGEDIAPGFASLIENARRGEVDENEWHYIRKDGSSLPVSLSVSAMREADQKIIGYLGVAHDLSASKAVQANLQQTEARYQSLFNGAGDAICLIDAAGVVIECNPATSAMLGCEQGHVIGKTVLDFSPEFQADGASSLDKARAMRSSTLVGKSQFIEWRLKRSDDQPFEAEISINAVDIGEHQNFQATVRDITERKSFEEQLAYQAGHDSLTDLPNRKSLHEAFPGYKQVADESGAYAAMLLLDLDRFKVINDTLGHHLGDLVIKEVGPRLQQACADESAMIARLGGDEFSVMLSSEKSTDEICELANRLLRALEDPFEVGGLQTSIGASIGVACYPLHGKNSHELLRAADVAMYEAKARSVGVKLYEPGFDDYSKQRLSFANDLAQAVKQDQLVLHYQPKIRIATGEVVGFEALVRWQHPEQGLLYPDAFIDLVEMSEVIHPFTHAVIELAVKEKKHLHELGYHQPVAINLSARNLLDDSCFQILEAALAGHNLSTTEVELELTEGSVMDDPERAISVLEKFNSRGVNIAVDDYGTGYSSLAYLRRLPVNALKIDRAFVMNLLTNTQDASIVRSTIAMAHSLDLKVIAEGVEEEKTLELLQTMACDEAQGYGICRPQSLARLIDWLSTGGQVSKAGADSAVGEVVNIR